MYIYIGCIVGYRLNKEVRKMRRMTDKLEVVQKRFVTIPENEEVA